MLIRKLLNNKNVRLSIVILFIIFLYALCHVFIFRYTYLNNEFFEDENLRLTFNNSSKKKILHDEGPWAALLLIPVIIISGAYWTSIPFYVVIATLWLFQRKSSIPWEAGITLMGACLLAIFIVSKTDYT